jgi:hypothetical protein
MTISEPLQINLYFVLHSKNDRRNRAMAGVPKIAAKLPEFFGRFNNVDTRSTGYDPLSCFLHHASKKASRV